MLGEALGKSGRLAAFFLVYRLIEILLFRTIQSSLTCQFMWKYKSKSNNAFILNFEMPPDHKGEILIELNFHSMWSRYLWSYLSTCHILRIYVSAVWEPKSIVAVHTVDTLSTVYMLQLTVVDPVCCVRHPHRDVGGEDQQPGHEDGDPRHRHRPHRDRGHREHNRQEPGAGKV